MFQLSTRIKFAIVLYNCILLANCQCNLKIPNNPDTAPSYKKFFGKQGIQISYNEPNIFLQEGEHLLGYCANTFDFFETGMNYFEFFKGTTSASLFCRNQNIIHTADGYALMKNVLSCVDLKWGVYESVSAFSWCQPSTISVILASKMESNTTLILGAACFDLKKNSLQTLHYLTGPNIHTKDHNDLNILSPIGLNDTGLGVKIINVASFIKHLTLIDRFSDDTKQHHEFWLNLANYKYQSIVQGGPLTKFFNKYDALLDIVWWPALASGNWKRFMAALEERSKNVTYNVFVGTSGAIRIPNKNKCTQEDFQELQMGDNNATVPAYVWTYLQATEHNEEFVFVGYNAPNYDFFPEKDIIFCEDICEQVEWLSDIRSTLRSSALGVTFCCSVESIRSGDFLNGFPLAQEQNVDNEDELISQTNETYLSTSNDFADPNNMIDA